MLKWFFRCPSCKESLTNFETFPLCRFCRKSFIQCPPLCPRCGSFQCLNQNRCLFPWRAHPLIQSFYCQHLLLKDSESILRYWNTSPHWPCNQIFLNPAEHLLTYLKTLEINAIVPLPEKHGHQSGILADWLSALTHVRTANAFTSKNNEPKLHPQWAEKRKSRILLVGTIESDNPDLPSVREIGDLLDSGGAQALHVLYLFKRPAFVSS